MGYLDPVVDCADMGISADRMERVRRHFDSYVADGRLPGWLITVARGGELAWVGSGGFRDREQGIAMSDDTLFRIYSMTKPITSVVAMMLYEEGLFDLNDDASRWIPELADARVWVGGTPSDPQTRPAAQSVKVWHLLSHTAGLTYGFQYSHNVDAMYRNAGYDFGYPKGADLAQAIHDWSSMPLLFEPGTKWNYSVGTDFVGRLIELWTGQTLDVVFQERLFTPLGMTDTSFYCPSEKAERMMKLYVPFNGTSLVYDEIGQYAFREPQMLSGGGGLISSARDYNLFMSMLVGEGTFNGVQYLSAATLDLMTRNHLPDGGDLEHWAQDSFSEASFAGVGFGLGFSVVIDKATNKLNQSEGSFSWGGAASTGFWVDPAEELTVGLYTQLLPSSTYPIRRELARIVYGALTE